MAVAPSIIIVIFILLAFEDFIPTSWRLFWTICPRQTCKKMMFSWWEPCVPVQGRSLSSASEPAQVHWAQAEWLNISLGRIFAANSQLFPSRKMRWYVSVSVRGWVSQHHLVSTTLLSSSWQTRFQQMFGLEDYFTSEHYSSGLCGWHYWMGSGKV